MSLVVLLSISIDPCLCTAKEERQFYTLKPSPGIETISLTSNVPVVPASNPLPEQHASGPIRTKRTSTTARIRNSPLPAHLRARALENVLAAERERKQRSSPTTPTEAAQPGHPIPSHPTDHPSEGRPCNSPSPKDISDEVPPISESPCPNGEVGDVEMTAEENHPATIPPPNTPCASCDNTIEAQVIPTLGVLTLVQTLPPTRFNINHDDRPDWLEVAIKFLQDVPYYMCLNKVVDLFLCQEARLGYLDKVSLHLNISVLH